MTTQYAIFKGLPTGLTITKKLFTAADPDTEVTGITGANTERTNAKGEYVITITKSAVITGIHTIILFVGSTPIATGSRTFAGTDGETATPTPEAVELDPATQTQISDILTDTGTTIPAQISALSGSTVQVASPNVLGNLVLTQGDSYDGIANPKATWTVTTDYTDGWSVTLTIRDVDDAVIYTTSGTVASSTSVQVAIAAPTGLTMTGTPGQWQGKFDVQLTKAGSKKTIALGVCYINEDQTR